MFETLKVMRGNSLREALNVKKDKLFILNRWLSNEPNNVELCNSLNKYNLYGVDEHIIKYLMFNGNDKNVKFIPYIKKSKKNESLNKALMSYFKLSSQELKRQKIKVTPELLKDMTLKLGWNKKECKEFGLDFVEPKKEKLKKEEKKKVSVFDFGN